MILNPTLAAVLAGLASGIIFSLSSAFNSMGALLIYLSLFPLLLFGLAYGARRAGIACVAGIVTSGILVAIADTLFYPLLVALPVMVFLRLALSFRETPGGREWYPVMRILAVLTATAAAIYMTFAVLASQNVPGGLQGIAAHELADNLAGADKDVAATMKMLLSDGLFVLLAGTAWLWLVFLYALARAAHSFLQARGLELRPDLGLESRGLPRWLMGLLGLSACFAFAGTGSDRLNGETVFLILLLPYFFAGMALIHAATRHLPARSWLLGIIYFLLMFPPWMALIAVVLGVYGQLAEMLDKRAEMG